jgi:hypothetical protein
MSGEMDLEAIRDKVRTLRKTAEELKAAADGFPAVERNVNRILASISMLEINCSCQDLT